MGSLFLKPLHWKHRLLCLREGHGYQHGPSRTCFEVLVEKFSYCYTLKERMLSIYQEKILLFNEGHSFRKDVYGVVQRGREETPTQPSRSSDEPLGLQIPQPGPDHIRVLTSTSTALGADVLSIHSPFTREPLVSDVVHSNTQ